MHDDNGHLFDDDLSDAFDKTVTHIPRVLIVEDTVELGELIQLTMERMHLLTFRETHGIRALERYNEVKPDLVLLDIGLPDMTGWKVLDAIKEGKAILKRPAIIVMTAYGDPANRLMGKLQGVDGYLIKPFTTEDIAVVVRDVLTQTAKEQKEERAARNAEDALDTPTNRDKNGK